MSIKSNKIKQTIYPQDFTDEDKSEYDVLYAQSKFVHADIEKDNPFIIHTAIIAHIRAKKGMAVEFTDEELMNIKNSYKLESKVFETNLPENHFAYDKINNPIYKPDIILEHNENSSNVILDIDDKHN